MSATTSTTEQSTLVGISLAASLPSNNILDNSLARTGVPLRPLVNGDDNLHRSSSNPSWWRVNHRRTPDFQAARYHPAWRELTGSLREDAFVIMMFSGCEILMRVSAIGRWFGMDYDYFLYRIAGEW
ncbi:hypothetical protein H0G86_011889 [Trichoderma simmonsii]|uniref:Uncharacterized protein n=1 Tax=Trichoderma simmonsii TaxID=1491479 RepID=A0A8G0LSE8_9HYPO|nr:hypothetical protein H0G86_011889 [Trichoderma simmonsii]